jgi:cell division protein FtsQ
VNAKTTIRKLAFASLWAVIGGGMLTLLIAAIGKKHRETCQDYVITIRGTKDHLFVDENDIRKLLLSAANGPVKGQSVSTLKLHQLEQVLESSAWIKDAELYFNNRDVLHVIVKEKEPIARVFTGANNSFYIDSLGRRMPLPEKLTARVPVFTGFPDKKVLSDKDSVLLDDLRRMAAFIIRDSFWMAQVAQININAERRFEIIPVIGNQVIAFGKGDDIEAKFHRLFAFYQQVMKKTGFEKYKTVDVQYDGQVVASTRSGVNKVDSIQLRKNIEKLVAEAQQQTDSIIDKSQQ